MKISIVIPAHNEEKYIADCLASIAQYRTADIIEVVVVDNASTDATATVAVKFSGVTVVRENQKGVSHARQRGFEIATGDFVAYVDADTRLTKEWFKIVPAEFSAHSDLVCLSGPHHFYDLSRRQNFFIWIYWNLFVLPLSWFTGRLISGGNFIVRRSALLTIGGFDTKIKFYGDDTNLARRLHSVGRVRWCCRLIVETSGRRLRSEGILKMFVVYSANFFSEIFFKKQVTGQYKDHR